MTLVDRFVRRQFTAAMALAMVLAMLLSGTALAQTPSAVDIGPACDGAPDAGFPDISGNTHEEAINCIAWYEITKGTNSGDYEPTEGVTRWQMALFIFRTAEYMDQFIDKDLPAPSDQGFNDIGGQSQEAQDAINVLAEIDVVKGKNSTTYAPSPVVRRDQMASFINRLQEWATGSTHEGPGEADAAAYGYPDVPRDNVHGTNIEDLTSAGIVQGYNDGTYKPARGVHRDEMASFIARDLAVNVNNGTIEPKDGDAPIEEPEQPANAELNVIPTSAVTLDADQSRDYTATGLTGDSYRITLVNTDNYSVDGDGNAVFVDADDSGTADAGDLEADITSVNGEDTGADDSTDVQTVPDPDDATDVVAPDADGEITFTVTGDGVSESLVPVVYVNGGDSTFLEVDDDGLPTEDFGVGGEITFEGEAVAGEVTLDQTSAQAGETITGSVTDPNTVESIVVAGCGLSQDVEIDVDGNFELTLPQDAATGDCELSFTVQRTDDTSAVTTVAFTITAAPQQLTDAPDLLMAEVSGEDTVTYTFDEAADGAGLTPADFRIYNAGGDVEGSAVAEIGTDPTQVIAEFAETMVDVDQAVLATILNEAVQDASGNTSYPSSAPLAGEGVAAGVTDGPDLVGVTNIERQTVGAAESVVADFVFDEEVVETAAVPGNDGVDGIAGNADDVAPIPASPNATGFQLITFAQDAPYFFAGTTIEDVSDNGTTVTVAFDAAVPVGAVTRGAVLAGNVVDDDDDEDAADATANSTQTEGVSGGTITTGASDQTEGPDLTDITVLSDEEVAFDFDEAVTTAGIVPANFALYNSDAETSLGDAVTAERSDSDSSVVIVTFDGTDTGGPAGTVTPDEAVGGYVTVSGVFATSDAEPNRVHELPIEIAASGNAGRTSLPDLVSVDVSFDAFGEPDVVYTFDDDITLAVVANADFFLVDAQGQAFPAGVAPADIDEDDDTVTFDAGQFSIDVAATAVIGSVEDADGVLAPVYTEGDVRIMRDATP